MIRVVIFQGFPRPGNTGGVYNEKGNKHTCRIGVDVIGR